MPRKTLWWSVTRSLVSLSLLPISMVLSWLLNELYPTVTRSEALVMSRAPSWTWYSRPKRTGLAESGCGASEKLLWSTQTWVAPRRLTAS